MRRHVAAAPLFITALITALALAARADDDPPEAPVPADAPVRGTAYALAPWRWQTIVAGRLAPAVGAQPLDALDVAAGRSAALPVVTGEGAAPTGWPWRLDGAGQGTLPAAPPAGQRIAAAFGVTTFVLAGADAGVAMLELRVHYADGIAVWLNGTEVARRALAANAGPTELARRPHGPEWETLYIPAAPALLRLGDNTLAVEVHPSGRRDAPAFEATLAGRSDRGIVRGPVIAAVGATTATIAVDTDVGTEASIEWGENLEHHAADPAGSHHAFALTGLPPRAQVRYRVHAGATESPIYTFHTAPAPGDVVRIGIYGDVRGGHAVHRRLVEAMLSEPLDLVAVTGDMVLRGPDEGDWQRFFTITAPLVASVLYLPAIGNHDVGAQLFTTAPAPPGRPPGASWYSSDLADVHLVFLDSNAYERAEQEAWLEADLAAARKRGARAILAFTHDGPYSRGYHKGNGLARARYVPILVRHHVDYLFSGHDHLYQRGDIGGLHYMVSGGGGASLYSISCGVPGKPSCKLEDGMQAIAKEHHFVVATLTTSTLELCVRRPDGRLLEPCTRTALWHP